MGCGKTGQAVSACDRIRAKSILVLTPGAARLAWQREFEKFSQYKRSYGIIKSSKEGVPDAEVLIASYTIIKSRPILEKLLNKNFDVLILDEAHALKNKDSVQTKVVYGAKCDRSKGLASRAKRVWLLTGTFLPNNLSEAYTHARALFPDVCKGLERFSVWRDFFCVTDAMGDRVVSNKNIQEFVYRMKPHTLRRRLEDVLPELPSIRIAQTVVDPDKLPARSAQEKEAEAIIKSALAQRSIEAGNIANLSQEDLRAVEQVAGMHIATNRRWCGIAKAHAVAELVKQDFESGMDKVVIFAIHREVFDILLKEIPGAAAINGSTKHDERDRLIDRFQGRIPDEPLNCIIIQLSIGATAVTLTASCNVVFAEYDWVYANVLQAAKRCHRFGQTRPVLARLVSLRDSIDEAVGYVLSRKASGISKIENALTSTEGIK